MVSNPLTVAYATYAGSDALHERYHTEGFARRWPMFIAKAILDSPQRDDIHNPEKLLTMLTGYKAHTVENPSKDEISEWAERVSNCDCPTRR